MSLLKTTKNSKLFLLVQKYIINSKRFEYTSDDNDLVYTFPYLCLKINIIQN